MTLSRLKKIAPYALTIAVFLFGTQAILAATRTWDGGGTTTSWSEAANWSSNTIPGASDIALFDGTSTKLAEVGAATSVGTLTVSSSAVLNQSIRLLANLTVGTLNIGYTGSIDNKLTLIGGFNNFNISTTAVLISGGTLDGNGTVNLNGSVKMVTPADKITFFGSGITTELNVAQTLSTDLVFYGNVDMNLNNITLGIYNLYLGPTAGLTGYADAMESKSATGKIFDNGGNAITSPAQGHLCKGFTAATQNTPFIFPLTVSGERATLLQIEIPSACTSGTYDNTVAPFPHIAVRAVYHSSANHPAATVAQTVWFHWSTKGYGMPSTTGMKGWVKFHQNYRSNSNELFSAIYSPNVEDMYTGSGGSLVPAGAWSTTASQTGTITSALCTIPFGGFGNPIPAVPCMAGFGDISIGQGDGTIPVELVSFSARYLDRSVRLNWQTATEVNNNGFHIERSADGRMWDEIDFVPGAGNSNAPIDYAYEDMISSDLARLDRIAYRLRQVDRDGTTDYSSIVYAYTGAQPFTVELYTAYPNPFNPSTTLSFSLQEATHVTLKVYNTFGQEVATVMNNSVDAGFHTVEFRGSELPSGVYIAVLEAAGIVQQQKLVLNK
jgi:hypothetical protein